MVEAKGAVLLDFWASWCPPCRTFSPVIDEVAREKRNLKVCRVNVDDEPELAAAFHISTIPTVALVRDGKLLEISAGVCDRAKLWQMANL